MQIDPKFINLQEGWRRIAGGTLAVKSNQPLSNLKENMENVAEMIALVKFLMGVSPCQLWSVSLRNMLQSGLIQYVNIVAETIFQRGVEFWSRPCEFFNQIPDLLPNIELQGLIEITWEL